jgi:hypothetical protein
MLFMRNRAKKQTGCLITHIVDLLSDEVLAAHQSVSRLMSVLGRCQITYHSGSEYHFVAAPWADEGRSIANTRMNGFECIAAGWKTL